MSAAARVARAYACEDDARRDLIVHACRMEAVGINQGKSGNLSLRWRRSGSDGFLVTPSALPYDDTTVDDLVWMALPGTAPSGHGEGSVPASTDGRRRPSSEWRFHRDLYSARPELAAIVHTHAVFCTTLACLPGTQQHGIPAFHYTIALAGGDSIRCAAYATSGSQALSDHVVAAMTDRLACLIANHGMIAAGRDLATAFALAVECETLARMYWQAVQVGEPVLLDPAEMVRVQARFADYRADPCFEPGE